MNTKLVLLLVALTGHTVLSRPDSYEFYENLGLSAPYGSSSEEDSSEIPLHQSQVQVEYMPSKDGPPEAHIQKLEAQLGMKLPQSAHKQWQSSWEKFVGKPLPEPTPAQKAKIDMKMNIAERDRMNELRELHGAPRLEYNEKLAAYAQNYAEKMAAKMANGAEFDHNPINEVYAVGENFAGSFGPQYDGYATNMWYFGEIDSYKHNGNRRSADGAPQGLNTNHFSQVVWKETKQVGCGSACYDSLRGLNECAIVCNFYPAANLHIRNRAGGVDEEETDKVYAKNVNMDIDWPTVYQMKKQVEQTSPVLDQSFKRDSQMRGY